MQLRKGHCQCINMSLKRKMVVDDLKPFGYLINNKDTMIHVLVGLKSKYDSVSVNFIYKIKSTAYH